MIELTAQEIVRFHSYVAAPDGAGCEIWTKGCNNHGYGRFDIWRDGKRRQLLVHRLAWTLVLGPPTLHLLHSCDNPPCCALKHLSEGTQAQNMEDARRKGRLVPPPHRQGEANGLAKLTEVDARAIRRACAEGVNQYALASHYGVSQTAISHIHLRKSWTHL